jgi:ABC-type nitrate/sulfonate/bicarbonate transport system permease component
MTTQRTHAAPPPDAGLRPVAVDPGTGSPVDAAVAPGGDGGPQGSRKRRFSLASADARRRTMIRASYTALALLVLWEIIGRFILTSKLVFAPLSGVLTRMVELWQDENLAHDIWVSYSELALGMLVASVAGIVIGGILGVSQTAREHFDPIVNALYATPLVALSPILILMFGIGIASKVAIIALLAVFPIIVNTATGLRTADNALIEGARSFTASRWQVFREVQLPNAVPAVVSGFRLAVGKGITGIFVGEFFGASAGVGYLITLSAQTFDVPAIFAGVLILAVSGVVLTGLLDLLERRVAKWRVNA